ncbi:MAG: TM2 domain-containing protein [Verrucomicrobiota bacterium]
MKLSHLLHYRPAAEADSRLLRVSEFSWFSSQNPAEIDAGAEISHSGSEWIPAHRLTSRMGRHCSRARYSAIAILAGLFGVHNFYIGRRLQGTLQLITAALAGLMLLSQSLAFYGLILLFILTAWVLLDLSLGPHRPVRWHPDHGPAPSQMLDKVIVAVFAIPILAIVGYALWELVAAI